MRFSVIIPCWHSENYVGRAITSVIEQTFKDYELLVMCETDDTPSISAVKALNITPVINCYGSSGKARNEGINIAKGEYILFLDSDDCYLHKYVFEELDRLINGVDIFSFAFIYGQLGVAKVFSNNGMLYPNVWSRAWKRSAIGETRFPNTSHDEDLAFCRDMFKKGFSHSFIDVPFVYYTYPREGSRTQENK